jgi:hypothetical protein
MGVGWQRLYLFVAVAVVATAACGRSQPPEPAPREILLRAAEAANTINSTHFSLQQQNGSLQMISGIRISDADGDVQRPDRLRMTCMMLLGGGLSAEEQLIAIGGEHFLTNPLTGRWQPSPSTSIVLRILDRNHGLSNLLHSIDSPQRAPNELVDAKETMHVKGILHASAFADMLDAQVTTDVVPSDVWVGADDFVVRMLRVEGPIDGEDSDSAVRTLTFSNVNQAVNIQRPAS